jgi:hypothetical protein
VQAAACARLLACLLAATIRTKLPARNNPTVETMYARNRNVPLSL